MWISDRNTSPPLRKNTTPLHFELSRIMSNSLVHFSVASFVSLRMRTTGLPSSFSSTNADANFKSTVAPSSASEPRAFPAARSGSAARKHWPLSRRMRDEIKKLTRAFMTLSYSSDFSAHDEDAFAFAHDLEAEPLIESHRWVVGGSADRDRGVMRI